MMVRLAAPVVAVSLLLLAVGVIGAWSVHRLQRDVTALMTQDVASVRAAEELVITLRQIETLLDQFLLTGAPGHLAAIAAQQPETERWLAEAERLAASAPERARLEAIRSAHGRFWQALARARGRAGAEPIEEAIGELEARVLTEALLKPCQAHLDSREQEV
ncbi:MAG TPA: histidine kinase, partial [Isosphaeraceae bacterium]